MTQKVVQRSSSTAALAHALRGFAGALRRRLRAQSDAGDLPPSQVDVLLRIERDGPQTTSSLARAAGMRPQSMGTIVAALQAAGLVTGAPDPADRRQTFLMLSDGCREWLQASRSARQDWLACAIHERLSPEEQRRLEDAVDLLERLVE